jgi:hypothetical protein
MATRVCRYGPPITALPRRWRQKTPARNAMANTNANAFVTAYNEHAIHRSFHPFARSSRKRDFGTTSTADGTRIFFEWLEKTYGARFGGKPLPMDGGVTTVTSDNGNTVNESRNCEENLMVTRESLELEDLEKLFQHEISVLKIRNFYPQEASSSLGRELALEGRSTRAQNWKVSTSKGLESSDVMTVGCHAPYNIALANKATDEYFREVRNELRDRRGLAPRDGNAIDNIKKNNNNRHRKTQQEERRRDNLGQSRLWPLDLLRLELDELWPRGAGGGGGPPPTHPPKSRGGGLPRLMVGPTRWKKGLVHVDELAPLSQTKGCFSANIYLQLPYGDFKSNTNNSEQQEQPVIELWPLGIRSKWDWYRVGFFGCVCDSAERGMLFLLVRVLCLCL